MGDKTMTDHDDITDDMNIGEVVQTYPDLIPVFLKHGLMCVGCHAAEFENIEQGAKAHGIDLDALMEDLNQTLGELNE